MSRTDLMMPPQMTAEQFNEWLAAMNAIGFSQKACRELLGVSPNTITSYKKKGGGPLLLSACNLIWLQEKHGVKGAWTLSSDK